MLKCNMLFIICPENVSLITTLVCLNLQFLYYICLEITLNLPFNLSNKPDMILSKTNPKGWQNFADDVPFIRQAD